MTILKNFLCFALIMMAAGCMTTDSQSPELDQLAAEAATMGKADLEAMVTKYKSLIAEKVNVVDSLKAKLKEIPLADMMSEKAQNLKSELSDTMSLVDQLKAKLAVYTDALKAFQQ